MAQLTRGELGRWDLTAIGINQVIGGAVFAMPAALAAIVGGWSPFLIVGVGIASMMIALTFGEVASRFDGTGGPYLYTRAAFGRFPAFEVGWMQWFTRVASWASVINVLVASLGFYWPSVTAGPARTALLTAIIAALAFINVLGIRQSAWVVNVLTIGKLVPLALFIVVGLTAVDVPALHIGPLPPMPRAVDQRAAAHLRVRRLRGDSGPRGRVEGSATNRAVRADHDDRRRDGRPDARAGRRARHAARTGRVEDAAGRRLGVIMGATGAAIITLGAVLSTLGNNMGQALSGSRSLFALAENGDVPRIFAKVSPRFGTPVVAILFTAAVSLVLATTGRSRAWRPPAPSAAWWSTSRRARRRFGCAARASPARWRRRR